MRKFGYNYSQSDVNELLVSYVISTTLCHLAQVEPIDSDLIHHNTYTAFHLRHKLRSFEKNDLVATVLEYFKIDLSLICNRLREIYAQNGL